METDQLISPEYVRQQREAHRTDDSYGSRSFNWGYLVVGIARIEGCNSVLDYGCGKGTLGTLLRRVRLNVQDYDPGIPGKDLIPLPADLVLCLDVMEHVEPSKLDRVIDHLASLTKKLLLVAIATRPASKTFPDGRNYHLVIEDYSFWRRKFEGAGFSVRRVWGTDQSEWVALMNNSRR